MKIEFWKHKSTLLSILFILGITFLCMIFVGIFVKNNSANWALFIGAGVILLLGLGLLFSQKSTILSKISFSEKGVEVKLFKKLTTAITWEEITLVKATRYGGRGNHWLTLVTSDKEIHMDITKKIYITILTLCPIENVKVMLKKIERFQPLFEKYNKTIK